MPPGSFIKPLNIAVRSSLLLVPSLIIASNEEKGLKGELDMLTERLPFSPTHNLSSIRYRSYLNAFSIAHCDGKAPTDGKEEKVSLLSLLSVPPIGTRPSLTVSLSSAAHRTTNNKHTLATATYPANDPSEDRALCGSDGEWVFAAVFDGHGGWQVSDTASRVLLPLILRKVEGKSSPQIEDAIVEAFLEAEELVVDSIRSAFQMGFGNVAKVGSCVIVALRKKDTLYLANCGDCRAVLGSVVTTANGGEECLAVKLNSEHNCREEVEKKLLELQHPGESDVVRCKNSHACYVKGRLQLTRSLGDAYLKYHEFNGSPDKTRGRYIPEPYTPPYVSHVPDVFTFPLQPQNKFVILGSDGVWDYISSQEAAEIVHEGMKNKEKEEVVAAKIVERALEIAAAECGSNLNRLKGWRPGRERRSRHDDTTVVVMYL